MSHKKTLAVIAALAGATALLVASNMSANAQGLPQGWYKVCSKQDNIDVCNTMNTVVSNTGQPLTAVNIVEVKGKLTDEQKKDAKRIGIQVPTGRFIPDGVQIQVNGGAQKRIPYVICNGPSCIANDVFDDKFIESLKSGSKLTVTTINFRGAANPIEISLDGFKAAYTGPGMQEKDFEAQQEKLQKAVQAKQQEIEDRMRAEQEKIKSGK